MNPSDVSFLDVERGKVDLVINRFDQMPQSFHQITMGGQLLVSDECRQSDP